MLGTPVQAGVHAVTATALRAAHPSHFTALDRVIAVLRWPLLVALTRWQRQLSTTCGASCTQSCHCVSVTHAHLMNAGLSVIATSLTVHPYCVLMITCRSITSLSILALHTPSTIEGLVWKTICCPTPRAFQSDGTALQVSSVAAAAAITYAPERDAKSSCFATVRLSYGERSMCASPKYIKVMCIIMSGPDRSATSPGGMLTRHGVSCSGSSVREAGRSDAAAVERAHGNSGICEAS